ncbi:MAG: Rieske 2Fe-2S domain-containing protein [Gemmatimonadota bacterium]
MPDQQAEPERPASSGRRQVLDYILGAGAVAFLASALYPVLRFVLPPKVAEAVTSSVVAGQVGELKPGSGRIFRFGNRPGLLVMTPAGEYRAFSAVCSHLNCTVQYREDHQQIWCACHNGTFDLKGKVISGPPPKGLDEFQVDLRGEEIVVSRASTSA